MERTAIDEGNLRPAWRGDPDLIAQSSRVVWVLQRFATGDIAECLRDAVTKLLSFGRRQDVDPTSAKGIAVPLESLKPADHRANMTDDCIYSERSIRFASAAAQPTKTRKCCEWPGFFGTGCVRITRWLVARCTGVA